MSEGENRRLAPVADDARIDVMDILRGFALIGIVFMNVEWFNRSATDLRTFDESLTGLDHAIGWLVRAFIEGKFYKLFALLFGMGFAVMLIRAREAGRPFGAWFVRRMLVLMLIGLAHAALLWGGDILRDYAFGGLVLLGWIYLFQTPWLRRFNTPSVFLKIGLIWLSLPLVAASVAGIGLGVSSDRGGIVQQWERDLDISAAVEARLLEPAPEEAAPASDDTEADRPDAELSIQDKEEKEITGRTNAERRWIEEAETEVAAFSGGSYFEATRYRVSQLAQDARSMVFFTFILLIPIFLVGYWFIGSGVLKNHRENRQLFNALAWIGLVFGTLLSVGGLLILQHPVWDISQTIAGVGFWTFHLGQLLLSTGYLGLIVTLAGKAIWQRMLQWLAPFGRMALTNYIMQTVILVLLFHGYAGDLYGEVSRSQQMLVVVAIVALQIPLSAWWLRRFRFGPLEWLWRSATYLSWQRLGV